MHEDELYNNEFNERIFNAGFNVARKILGILVKWELIFELKIIYTIYSIYFSYVSSIVCDYIFIYALL